MVFAGTLGLVPAGADDAQFELASLQTPGPAAAQSPANAADRALIKEDDCESPEVIALIESNREDRERTAVMDR